MTTLDERDPDDRSTENRVLGEAGPDSSANPYAGAFEGFFDEDAEPEPSGPDLRTFDRHRVTAVLVSHNGRRWLPYALAAIDRLALAPQRVIAVDTGSTDGSPVLLASELGAASVLAAPVGTGFGA